MEFIDLLLKRRSVRRYSGEEVSNADLDMILKAGLLAPTGRNKKECMFLVIENRKTLEKLSEIKDAGSQFLNGASKAVAVVGNTLISDTWIEDSSIALGYMHLMAASLDVGSCWIQVRNRKADGVDSEDIARDILGLDEFYGVVGILALGMPEGDVEAYSLDDIDKSRIHFLVGVNE